MTTASEIINQAYREANITPIGRQPTQAEVAEGVYLLNQYTLGLFGTQLGEFLADWPIPWRSTAPRDPQARFKDRPPPERINYPPINSRVAVGGTEDRTVYLPRFPNDGTIVAFVNTNAPSTLEITADGAGRFIDGLDTVVLTGAEMADEVRFFYRADKGMWHRIGGISTPEDTVFLPQEFDDMFVCGLAQRLAPRNGVAVQAVTLQREQTLLRKLNLRYRQPTPEPGQWSPLNSTEQSFGSPLVGYSNDGGF